MYVRTRIRSLFGPLKIKFELLARGLSYHQIAEAMPGDHDTWFDAALQWAEKRNPGELDYAGRAKLYRSLKNRGFTHEQANAAINRISQS